MDLTNCYNDIFKNVADSKQSALIMLIGPPGSGKTAYADTLVDSYGFTRISPDDIRLELTGDMMDQSRNKEVFGRVYSELSTKLEAGKKVVYDATNCRDFYRKKIIDICSSAQTIIGVLMSTSLVECLERNNSRVRHVPVKIIEDMYMHLQSRPPHIFEGYDMIVRV